MRLQEKLQNRKISIRVVNTILIAAISGFAIAIGLVLLQQRQIAEKNYRIAKTNEIKALNTASKALLSANQRVDALVTSLKAISLVKSVTRINPETQSSIQSTLQKVLNTNAQDRTEALDLDRLIDRGCDSLGDYFINHPQTLKETTSCHNSTILSQAATVLMKRGEDLAKKGDVNGAIAQFQQAKEWNSELNLDPTETAQRFADQGEGERLILEGEALAKANDIEGAIAKFQSAQKIGVTLNIDPRLKAQQIAAVSLIEKGKKLVVQGEVKPAIADFNQAKLLAPTLNISVETWDTLCWFGSLHNYASEVMDACEKAVAFSPPAKTGYYRNSRGIARAMTGDRAGAIADFKSYFNWSGNAQDRAKRQRWIASLRKGKNPFTRQEIESLLN